MIGLIFFGAIGLWIILAIVIGLKLPKWFRLKDAWSWLFVPLILLGPFAPGIVGMQQYRKLCQEQTTLQMHPNAAYTKRARVIDAPDEILKGYAVEIKNQKRQIIDMDTKEVVVMYNYFLTYGGLWHKITLSGYEHCSASQSNHPDSEKLSEFESRVELIYGDAK